MQKIFSKVRAASICQASRVIYGAGGALLLWKETNGIALGYWYTAVSWLSLLAFIDIGFTATAVDLISLRSQKTTTVSQQNRLTSLATGYFLVLTVAVACIGAALAIAGRLPHDWHVMMAIAGLAAANLITSITTFQISLLQATGSWERTQYLPVIPYLVATVCMGGGLLGFMQPLSAFALGQCVLTGGLLLLVDREFYLKGINALRLGSLARTCRSAWLGVLQADIRYYYSIMACAAIMRIAMFAGSLKMNTVELGDIGRLNQTLFTVISVCFFPVNGLANRVIGDLRSGKDRKQIHLESLQLITAALVLAFTVCLGVTLLINQRVAWLGATNLSLYKQVLLVIALLFDALAMGIVPMLAYLRGGTYWKDSVVLVCLAIVPWVVYLSVPSADFVWVKVISGSLIAAKIAVDYRRTTA